MSYSHQPPLQTSNASFPLLISNVSSSTKPSSLHAHLQTGSTSFPLLINGILFSTLHPTPIKLLSRLATPHFPSRSTMSHLQLHPLPPFVLISRLAVPHFPSWSTVSYFWLYVLLLSTSSPDWQCLISPPNQQCLIFNYTLLPSCSSPDQWCLISPPSQQCLFFHFMFPLLSSFFFFFFLSHFIFVLSIAMPITNITFSHLQMISQEQIFMSYLHRTYYIKLSKAPLKIILSLG